MLYLVLMSTNSLTGRKTITEKISSRLQAYYLEFITGFLWWHVGQIPFHTIRNFWYQLFGIKLGTGSTLHMGARIYDPRNIVIGDDTIIGEKATLDGRKQLANSDGGLEIGSHVDIASEVMIWTSQHDLSDPDFKPVEKKVIIEDYVFIGPRAIILPGVVLGKGSVVAAGAVVTKSVEPMSMVAGVPAKPIGTRTSQLNYTLGRYRLFQ